MTNYSPILQLVDYTYNEVEYYRKTYEKCGIAPYKIVAKADLPLLPILTKETACEQNLLLVAKPYQRYPGTNQVEIRRVGGLDGRMLKVFWSYADADKSAEYIWNLRKNKHGVTPEMRCCQFHGINYKGNKLFNHVAQVLSSDKSLLSFSLFGLTDSRLLECYQKILNFRPQWLSLYPGVAVLLQDFMRKNHLPPPACLKYIEIQGVGVSEELLQKVEAIFGVPTANLLWMAEVGGVAYTCDENMLHVLEQNVSVETIKDGKPVLGEEGDVYITSLTNYAMPIIRYETGLRGVLSSGGCLCGGGQTLKLAPRQAGEIYNLGNGSSISRHILDGLVEITNENMQSCIKRYSIEQTGPDEFYVEFELKPAYKGWGPSVKDEFLKNTVWPELSGVKWNLETGLS